MSEEKSFRPFFFFIQQPEHWKSRYEPIPNKNGKGHLCLRIYDGTPSHCFGCAQISDKNYVYYTDVAVEFNENEKKTIKKYCLTERDINTMKIIIEICFLNINKCSEKIPDFFPDDIKRIILNYYYQFSDEELIKKYEISTEIITCIREQIK
jgi:hypothetical protein